MSESYDYVVVGAGSAGAVVAARLTEDPAVRVLLLEAGPPAEADEISIPAAFANLFKTRWDWNYQTAEQKQLHGRRAYWPRMKALGGCSSMNAMIYIRGNAHDYDTWRDAYGASGWGYDDVLPYFVRAEHNQRLGAPYHGTDGPLNVEDRVFTHELTDAWVQSAVVGGLDANDDFNGASQEGAGVYQVTCRKGRRFSVADAYLAPAADRPNLTVRTGAFVTRIVIEGGRATGIAYRRGGEDHVAHADAEVVLSGGAVNSPQLLMLSGIGPAAHLRELGIDVVADLPVGENLHDHPVVPLIWKTRNTTDLAQATTLGNLLRWKATGKGPLASNIGEGGAFYASRDGLAAPDIQIHVAPSAFYDNGMHEPQARAFTVGPTLVNVASRGRLRLRSTDPAWHPDIDAAYYDDPTDLDAIVAGAQRAIALTTSGPMAGFLDELWMPHSRHAVPTEGELVEHVRQYTQTLYHPVGTCAMGTDERAVVDPELRVRGVDGLRVVDASVMPMVPRGNTNAPTIMVGEKAADLLRGRPAPTAARLAAVG
ncbi:choline dehydrogenase [Mumia flava]|uniref:Choline dehydrogenase n=1 Tax=Mumia flava TaxID=1348852 RepID=A0A0B2BVE4_9ACTN|nr:GMC family oxidoreductase N-terminal domain-containing protein [Mumia flava]PJJ58206.1 choline dehydrogenase [Mumia flava]